ncbi:MAG: hypothetical protein JSW52_05270, partial [Candidatus Coatesbacteria bacterium]
AQFDLPSDTTGLTFDGEYWWMIKQPEETIYCFDYGGDYVTDFPAPAPNPMGLAWDGEYLWISCYSGGRDNVRIYQMTIDGSTGPYDDFSAYGFAGLTLFQNYIATLWETPNLRVNFYTKSGSLVRTLELIPPEGYYEGDTYSISNDDEYLWVSLHEDFTDYAITGQFDAYTGEYTGVYLSLVAYEGLTSGVWSETFIGLKSFGNIKAFFQRR